MPACLAALVSKEDSSLLQHNWGLVVGPWGQQEKQWGPLSSLLLVMVDYRYEETSQMQCSLWTRVCPQGDIWHRNGQQLGGGSRFLSCVSCDPAWERGEKESVVCSPSYSHLPINQPSRRGWGKSHIEAIKQISTPSPSSSHPLRRPSSVPNGCLFQYILELVSASPDHFLHLENNNNNNKNPLKLLTNELESLGCCIYSFHDKKKKSRQGNGLSHPKEWKKLINQFINLSLRCARLKQS